MYKYVSDVSFISHNIIKNYCNEFKYAVDATLGNGHDTDFLSELFEKVYAFDIQETAVKNYKTKCKCNVEVFCSSHEYLDQYINHEVNCVIYNLGFLPGGDKNITTITESTVRSLKKALKLINKGGIIALSIYSGHKEGAREKVAIHEYVRGLPKNEFGVLLHEFLNRDNNPPELIIIERK